MKDAGPNHPTCLAIIITGSKWEHRRSLPIMPVVPSVGLDSSSSTSSQTQQRHQQQYHLQQYQPQPQHAAAIGAKTNTSSSTASSSGGSITSFSYQTFTAQQQSGGQYSPVLQAQQKKPQHQRSYSPVSQPHTFLYRQQMLHQSSSLGDYPSRPATVKDPHEFFRKSCSMKIAAEEAVEAGDEAEEDEDDEEEEDTDGGERKSSQKKAARGDRRSSCLTFC